MIYELVIPILLLVVPWLVVRYIFVTPKSQRISYLQSAPYLLAIVGLWVIGALLPGFPLANGATDTFVLHTIGGVVAAILFWYVVRVYQLRFSYWWHEPVFLYFFVSGLGVLNELFEFCLSHVGLLFDVGADAWWDLVANTLGALLAFAVVYVLRRIPAPR